MNYYTQVLQKYAVFSGRATRREYWMFTLINVIIGLSFSLIGQIVGDRVSILSLIYTLAVFIPSLAVFVRRLHDTSRSGWWFLLAFIPIIGFLVLLVFMIQDSKPGENQYGPNPKGV